MSGAGGNYRVHQKVRNRITGKEGIIVIDDSCGPEEVWVQYDRARIPRREKRENIRLIGREKVITDVDCYSSCVFAGRVCRRYLSVSNPVPTNGQKIPKRIYPLCKSK